MTNSQPTSDEREDFPIRLIIDQMRDDYEGRHWIDESDDDEVNHE